jgi:HEAT repeat protein
MLVMAFGNMRNPRAIDILVEMLDDEEVAGHALEPLGKLKAKAARSKIEQFLAHEKSWIRKDAMFALARIDNASESR